MKQGEKQYRETYRKLQEMVPLNPIPLKAIQK
jgi:hypothetical protein